MPTGAMLQLSNIADLLTTYTADRCISVLTSAPGEQRVQISKADFDALPAERRYSYLWDVTPEDTRGDEYTVDRNARFQKASLLASQMDRSRATKIWNDLESQNGTVENPFREKDTFHIARFVAVAAAMCLGKYKGPNDQDITHWIEKKLDNIKDEQGNPLFPRPSKDYRFK